MSLAVHQAAGTKKAANVKVRTASGVEAAASAFIRTTLGIQRIFSQFSISLDKASVSGFRNSAGTTPITTNEVTVTPEGAVGAVTYAWSRTDGGAHPWTIDSPSSATTTFTTDVARASIEGAGFHCLVTDASGHSATSSVVSAVCENAYGGTL